MTSVALKINIIPKVTIKVGFSDHTCGSESDEERFRKSAQSANQLIGAFVVFRNSWGLQ